MSSFTFNINKTEVEAKPKADNEEEDDEGGAEGGANPEEESTATFKPLVQLEKVEVKTEEEDENILFVQRSQLYQFAEAMLDKGTGEKQWLEKGKGDVKILKHKENDRIRILMRQEKTLKIICNHFIDPRIIMKPMPQSEKSKIWVAYDFSDGEKLVETTFCIKFNTPEIANEFQKAFESAQTHNKKIMSGADTAESTEEVDQLAKEIEKKAEVKEDAEEQKPKE